MVPLKPAQTTRRTSRLAIWLGRLTAVALLAGVLLWAYWPTLANMSHRWATEPQYSHGFLVPVFAALILSMRREWFPAGRLVGSYAGLTFLALAVALRVAGAYFFLDFLEGLSLPLMLAGLVLWLGGWPAWRWAWPALAYLVFLLPLPFQLEVALAQPLRQLGTVASTYALQVLGFPAIADGNVIIIDDVKLGVIDACNGLGMLMTFFALATAFALVIHRPLLDRIVLVVSAVPIALIANVARITATAVAYQTHGKGAADVIMHDLAGWLMMPLALILLWAEMKYLDWLLVEGGSSGPLPLRLQPLTPRLTYAAASTDPGTRSEAALPGQR